MHHAVQPETLTEPRGSRATLEILGAPGAAVAVISQPGAAERVCQIYAGTMPPSGQLRLRVPRVCLQVRLGTVSAPIDVQHDTTFMQVDLRHPGADLAI